jgi:hypothetical protein
VPRRWTGAAPGPRVILEHRIHDGNEKDVAALPLAERSVVPFLQGSLSEQAFVDDLRSQQVLPLTVGHTSVLEIAPSFLLGTEVYLGPGDLQSKE